MRSLFQNQKAKLIAILALALALRLIGIASRPIWYDEAFSALFAEQGPAAILSGTVATNGDSSAAEEHPPAYYFFLWGWIQLFGSGLVSVRMLSVLFSLGISLCIYGITAHLFDGDTPLVATAISAVLPFEIHYGQEIRMYVMLAFWLGLATYAFLKRSVPAGLENAASLNLIRIGCNPFILALADPTSCAALKGDLRFLDRATRTRQGLYAILAVPAPPAIGGRRTSRRLISCDPHDHPGSISNL